MTNFVTSKDGTQIGYDKLGSGPPLVIVPGALAIRTFVFARKMAENLAKSFTVYSYDRRGRGDSGDNPTYTVQKEIDDLAAVCAAAGGKPFVVGFSSGAALALHAAAGGVPMQQLYAYEPPFVAAAPGGKPDTEFKPKLEAFRANDQRSEAVAYFMRTVGVPAIGVAFMKLLPMWKTMKSVAHTLPYDAAIMDRFVVPTAVLAKVKVPTLVANGGKTAPNLKAAAEAVAKAVPKAQHRVVPGQTHAVKPEPMRLALVEAFKPGT